jgi:hypothetical protein
MTKDCWFASVDLKDAYYSVNVNKICRKFLRFIWKDQCYEFTALPMGLTSSPRVFTKLLKPVFSVLHKHGFSSLIYIDDTFLQGNSFDACLENVFKTVSLLDNLGFTIHPEKYVLVPRQSISFLGFLMDSRNMTVALTPEKANGIIQDCEHLLRKHEISIRDFSKVIGKFVAAEPAIPYAPLHIKVLEIEKNKYLQENHGNFDNKFILSQSAKNELTWWIDNANLCKNYQPLPIPEIIIQSDSSKLGWGGLIPNTQQKTGGHWSYSEQKSHINILELKAAFLTLQSFFSASKDKHIAIQMDSMVAVSYINKMGGRKKELNNLCRDMWGWCIARNIWISATHVPGVQNVQADKLSRKLNDDLEWMLNKNIFHIIHHKYSLEGAIDLFASRINKQLPRHVAYLSDPLAIAVDAFIYFLE